MLQGETKGKKSKHQFLEGALELTKSSHQFPEDAGKRQEAFFVPVAVGNGPRL